MTSLFTSCCRAIPLGLVLVATGCAAPGAAPTRSSSPPAAPTPAAADTSLFAAVVRTLRSSEEPGTPVQVDPRPVAADSAIVRPGQVAWAEPAEPVVARRRAALERLGVPRGDFLDDRPCTFSSGGNPVGPRAAAPASDPQAGQSGAGSDRCRARGRFSTFAIALPRPVDATPPEASGLPDGERVRRHVVVRVIEITDGSYHTWDVVAVPRQGGRGWTILGKRAVESVWS